MDEELDSPPPKRRKGGQRQRLQQEAAETAGHSVDSALAEFLECAWAWGDLSPQQVQVIASKALSDTTNCNCETQPARLLKLASLGTAGAHPSNCHRDLMAYLPQQSRLPSAHQVMMPFKAGPLLQSLMLPHEVFSKLYHQYPEYWRSCFLPGGDKELAAFWKGFAGHPSMADGTFQSRPSYRTTLIPLGIHGDGVPITGLGKVWCKLMQVYSWHGLLCQGGAKATLFLMWASFEQLFLAGNEGTLQCFFSIMKWSFQALLAGTWPDKDFRGNAYPPNSVLGKKAGTRLAGKYAGALVATQGDMEFFASSLGLPRWSSNHNCCILCSWTASEKHIFCFK